ncbi:hypothetical protein C8R46DRAFT_1030186 [Mycena filopes]|nr:hypothetical protein C8R46DRAFT_1030186 [Mycena filopes]
MPANSAPLMRRSAPLKKRSTKRSPAQPKPDDYVPADACLGEERDLRRFALKRSSLEKALTSQDTFYSPYSQQPLPDLSVPQFTTVDYTAVSAAPASPSVSPCSTPRPRLTRTSSTALPPKSAASLSTMPPKRPSMDRSASIYNFPNTLAQLEVPRSCSTRLARASIDSDFSAGSGSRRSSIASGASGSAQKPRLRAFPRFFVLVAQTTYTTLKHHLVPPPTPEQQLTIPPVPMMRDAAPRPRRSSLIKIQPAMSLVSASIRIGRHQNSSQVRVVSANTRFGCVGQDLLVLSKTATVLIVTLFVRIDITVPNVAEEVHVFYWLGEDFVGNSYAQLAR